MEVPMNDYYYGCPFTDEFLFNDPQSLPRYGGLARKVMIHYLSEAYNPHLHGLAHEPFLRKMIKQFMTYKVFHHCSTYDWDWLDQLFRKYFNGCFGMNLPVNESRLKSGANALAKPSFLSTHSTVH